MGLEDLPTDEIYRILFSNIERRISERPAKSIAVTSAVKGEGKTTTAIQLAKVMARDFGRRVLLLEGDIKNPQLGSIPLEKDAGGQAIRKTAIKGLEVMNLASITKSKPMNAPTFAGGLKKIVETVSESYDFILIDCPPVMPMVDMQIIAKFVEAILVVVRVQGPPRSLVNKALDSLPREKIIGVAFNGAENALSQYGYPYHY